MSWIKVEDSTTKSTSGRRTVALTTWRCSGCRHLAVGPQGQNPGACLFAGCTSSKIKKAR